MIKIIQRLNKVGKQIIDKSFQFKSIDSSLYAIGDKEIMSRAKNLKNNSPFDCNVIRFFDDFWLYARIDFREFQPQIEPSWDKGKKEEYLDKLKTNFISIGKSWYGVFVSISIFQGDTNENIKTQLFRAEWDNYAEQSDKHPQPHWHIYSQKEISSSEDFNKEIESEENPFNEYMEDDGSKIINIDRFHFAMNGQWSDNKTDVHTISVESDLINWFQGLLNHLKKELAYVKEK